MHDHASPPWCTVVHRAHFHFTQAVPEEQLANFRQQAEEPQAAGEQTSGSLRNLRHGQSAESDLESQAARSETSGTSYQKLRHPAATQAAQCGKVIREACLQLRINDYAVKHTGKAQPVWRHEKLCQHRITSAPSLSFTLRWRFGKVRRGLASHFHTQLHASSVLLVMGCSTPPRPPDV